jgi:outer membrane receptor protein involved in Fe transport
VAALYELTREWNLFGNIARGRRPEVITASTTNAARRFTTLPAEEVDSYEVGAKGVTLGGRLALDASVFFYDYTNFQSSVVNANGQIVPVNAGNATSSGLETQAVWSPTEAATFVASYGYNKARFEDEVDGRPQQFGGNRLRLSPDHTASLAAVFTKDVGIGELRVIPSVVWQSEVYFDNTQRALLSEDAYDLFNLTAELTLQNGLAVEGYVTNLFDENYLIDAGNTGDAFGIPTFIAGPPRFYGVRVKKDF